MFADLRFLLRVRATHEQQTHLEPIFNLVRLVQIQFHIQRLRLIGLPGNFLPLAANTGLIQRFYIHFPADIFPCLVFAQPILHLAFLHSQNRCQQLLFGYLHHRLGTKPGIGQQIFRVDPGALRTPDHLSRHFRLGLLLCHAIPFGHHAARITKRLMQHLRTGLADKQLAINRHKSGRATQSER